MSIPEDKKSKLQTKEPNNPLPLGVLQASIDEATSLERVKNTDAARVNNKQEKAKWEKEIDQLYRSYEFHLDFAKA